jgi:hypothetical protein
MTPERMAKLVAWWVRCYTRDLSTPIAQRRINEIDADLHDTSRTHGPKGPATGVSPSASCRGWLAA